MTKNILEKSMIFDVDLILNGLVLVFLIIAVIYAGILNYRLKKLRSNKDEVDMAIIRFDQAVSKAEESINYLKEVSGKTYNALLESIQKAQSLRDELFFLLERGETLASKMEIQIRQSRKETSPQPEMQQEAIEEEGNTDQILKMLRSTKAKDDAEVTIVQGSRKQTLNMHTKAEESLIDMLRSAR